jgi:hypothetical protein
MRKFRQDNPFIRFILALCGVSLLAYTMPIGAQQSVGPPLTQRRINEWAAALLRARSAIVEETGLRRVGEPLNVYLIRIAHPLPGENPASRQRRLTGYVDALAAAVQATAELRRLPELHAADPANLQVWQRAVRDLAQLPDQVHRLREAGLAASTLRPSRRFDLQLTECVALVLGAFAALRDAQP